MDRLTAGEGRRRRNGGQMFGADPDNTPLEEIILDLLELDVLWVF